MIKYFNYEHNICENSGAKMCLTFEIDVKLIFILTIHVSLFVEIVSYFVFLDHIRESPVLSFDSAVHKVRFL